MSLVPHALLFKTRQRLLPLDRVPKTRGKLGLLAEKFRLRDLTALDGGPGFADLRMGWHVDGLHVSLVVSGKKVPPRADAATGDTSDGLQLWIDTRNTPGVHRANRFCQSFQALPTGGGATKTEPHAIPVPIPRAKEIPLAVDPELLRAESSVRDDGYELSVWIPAEALHGYDPEHSPLLGFFYVVQDAEFGRQTAGVGPEFPFASDPTLWQSVELSAK